MVVIACITETLARLLVSGSHSMYLVTETLARLLVSGSHSMYLVTETLAVKCGRCLSVGMVLELGLGSLSISSSSNEDLKGCGCA